MVYSTTTEIAAAQSLRRLERALAERGLGPVLEAPKRLQQLRETTAAMQEERHRAERRRSERLDALAMLRAEAGRIAAFGAGGVADEAFLSTLQQLQGCIQSATRRCRAVADAAATSDAAVRAVCQSVLALGRSLGIGLGITAAAEGSMPSTTAAAIIFRPNKQAIMKEECGEKTGRLEEEEAVNMLVSIDARMEALLRVLGLRAGASMVRCCCT